MKILYALYSDPVSAEHAVDRLRSARSELNFNERQIFVASGEPHEDYDLANSQLSNRTYSWAVLGAAIGGLCGYFLTTMSEQVYPIRTGGMPIAPLWTNGIIIYELMMLGAILATLISLLSGARLSCFKQVIEDTDIWQGKILVGVSDPPRSSLLELEKCLLEAGATEVRQSDGHSIRSSSK